MREIKFRAWDKINKKMARLTLLGLHWELDDRLTVYGVHDEADHVSKDAPVMQYTGLKDKNGKEIYEGDIVEWHYNKWNNDNPPTYTPTVGREVVEYAEADNEVGQPYIGFTLPTNLPSLEIIGNIYENPELLSAGIGENDD